MRRKVLQAFLNASHRKKFENHWYNETLQKWETEKKTRGSCSESSKKSHLTNRIFCVAAADAKDNVTQQLSDPDNNISNLI